MELLKIIKSGELYKLRKYRIKRSFLRDYKKNKLHPIQTFLIHRRGFTVGDWNIMKVNKNNYKSYLSSKQYSSIHPINGFYSKMIDDKMAVKYIVNGTELAKCMPDYYYTIDEEGNLYPLMDATSESATFKDVLELLKQKGKLAIKLVDGAIGKGFYKATFDGNVIYVNEKSMTEKQFVSFLRGCRHYIISEYLRPHPDMAKFWPDTTNTMRYLVGKVGREWRMIKCFVRFGSKKTGVVENFNRGGVLCYVNNDGYFNNGYVLTQKGKKSSSQTISIHPDTKQKLEGRIPCWDQVLKAVSEFEKLMPQAKYLGFDFVITADNQVKILEINSLTSLDSIQMDGSILETENGKWFFSSFSKIAKSINK